MEMEDSERENRPENHVGLAIRRRRRELNMSQTTLAREMGVSQAIISNYEIGDTPVRADDLPRFCKILDVPMTYFFGKLSQNDSGDALGQHRPNYVDYSGKGAAKDFYELDPKAQETAMELYRLMMARLFDPMP
jgi:transcriptional regulator with XRE-family HTH domain